MNILTSRRHKITIAAAAVVLLLTVTSATLLWQRNFISEKQASNIGFGAAIKQCLTASAQNCKDIRLVRIEKVNANLIDKGPDYWVLSYATGGYETAVIVDSGGNIHTLKEARSWD